MSVASEFDPRPEASEGSGLIFRVERLPVLVGETGDPAFSLGAPLSELPARASLDRVILDAPTEHLDVVSLRRFLHRATYLLRDGGIALWSDLDPEGPTRAGHWPGSKLEGSGAARHRPLRHHLELLRVFPFRALTPRPGRTSGRLIYGGQRALASDAFSKNPTRSAEIPEAARAEHAEARYGRDSLYRRFDRLAEPEIVDDLLYALARMRLRPGQRVLALGVNDGRELELAREVVEDAESLGLSLWGIDLSASAIEGAHARFPEQAEQFLVGDASRLESFDLPSFHAILILNTLQCRTVDRDALLNGVLKHLDKRGSVLVSIPDCHHGPSDILRRPYDRDDPRHDRSVVHKEMRFLTRFFHRARFRHVECFGSYDAFLLARRA